MAPGPKTLEVKLRPLKTEMLKGASRIHVSQDALIELTNGTEGNKPCFIEKVGDESTRREAILSKSLEQGLGKKAALIPKPFQDVCNFTYTDNYRITCIPGSTVPKAKEVVLEDITTGDGSPVINTLTESAWVGILETEFCRVDNAFAGMTFKNVFFRGVKRTFVVKTVNGKTNGNAQFVLDTTRIIFAQPGGSQGNAGGPPVELQISGVHGIDGPVGELNFFLERFKQKPDAQAIVSCGVVIHGGHGTGKTMLLDRLVESGWGSVHRIEYYDKLTAIEETFQQAREQQPSIVTIDGFERLVDKERSNRTAVIRALCDFLDKLSAGSKRNDDLPQVLVLVTCLDYATDIPLDLRRPGRLVKKVFLPLPDVECRRAIIKSFNLPIDPAARKETIDYIAEKTHAYDGTDLVHLVNEAMTNSKSRRSAAAQGTSKDAPRAGNAEAYLSFADMDKALVHVRPTAMHDVNLKPPPIHWSDIGGQEPVKAALRHAVMMLNEKPEMLKSFVPNPPKGFLLYGPPGCSKTMAAQAMATESGLNFFAVKGAELLNQYVGESERAIRHLFARARGAAPSMIFFDEIDSIGGQRHGMGGGGATTSHGSLNVLTTMLNEMDGFEAMKDVLVLAATNRPQTLDPALLRPGRFDKLIYVSPPDRAARETIFRGVCARQKVLDADPADLADLTDGFSGAEIKGICEAAGEAAYIKYKLEDGPLGITKDNFRRVIETMPKMITQAMLDGYRDWENKFKH